MSALQDLAASLRAGAGQLPVDVAVAAADRLAVATELLAWVRRTSPHPLGVPQLAAAVEHLEHAVGALRAAQDAIDAYLVALGLAAVPAGQATGQIRRPQVGDHEPQRAGRAERPVPLRRWWSRRVDELTTEPGDEPAGSPADTDAPGRPPSGAGDPVTLLRTVAAKVRGDDRGALRAELRRVDPPVGLGLSAITPAALRRLATDLLGRAPRPDDVDRLRQLTGERVRQLLPGVPAAVPQTLLERICQVPPEQRRAGREQVPPEQRRAGREREEAGEPVDHPTDSAVAGAVLVGVLAHRLGREPDALGSEPDERGGDGTGVPGRPHA